jgi:hypothetical protein
MLMHAEAAAHLAQTAALCALVLKKIEIDDVYRQKASARGWRTVTTQGCNVTDRLDLAHR